MTARESAPFAGLAPGARPEARGTIPRALVLVVAAVASGCLAVVSPRKGSPVEVGEGKALVFGRIRVTSPQYQREFLVFSSDPTEHVIPPDPVLNLELRGIRPPGGPVKYTSSPSPGVEEDGSFAWILAEGDYVLASNPRRYGSSLFDAAETTVLARFTVPRGAGTVYVGTLWVALAFETQDLVEAYRGRETSYAIAGASVADESGAAFASLLARYPSVPEPRATVAMVPEPQ